jgi:hypothetical protein
MRNELNVFNILESLLVDVVRGHRARRDRLASAAALGPLTAWAATAGFAVADPFDADVIDRCEEAFLLCAPDEHREAGTALRRIHAVGTMYLVDSFCTDGAGARAATGVITTSAAIRLEDLPAELPTGWERRRTRHSLIVHTSGPLDLALAQELAAWLTAAEASLPRAPGTARL